MGPCRGPDPGPNPGLDAKPKKSLPVLNRKAFFMEFYKQKLFLFFRILHHLLKNDLIRKKMSIVEIDIVFSK